MIPANNIPHIMGHDLESSEDESSYSSIDSTSSGDSISADEFDVPSTSMVLPVILVYLPSPVSSAGVTDLTSPIQSTASMPPADPMSPVPSTSRGIQENYDDYRFETARRCSFRSWPISFIDPVSLAAAGFYYTGEADVVRCFECQLVVNLWTDGDIPMQIHEMRSPECGFIRNEHCDNVPGQELYETSAEAPIEITDKNPERSNSENDTNEMTLVEKLAALEEENRALKEARSCKVCTERDATVIFLPCGHLVTCHYCSPDFTKCIICGKIIKKMNRTFLA